LGNENQDAFINPSVILGHEFVGHVIDLGQNVTDFELRDHITSEQIVPCGKYRFCQSEDIGRVKT